MKFTLTINCDNAVFTEPGGPSVETALILKALADDLTLYGDREREGRIYDTNGNRCGEWSFVEQ